MDSDLRGLSNRLHTKLFNIFYQMLQERKKNTPQHQINEASIHHYHDIMDFNSRANLLYHDESMNISQIAYNMGAGNENSRNFSHIENHQNTITINFWEHSRRNPYLEDQSIKIQDENIYEEDDSFDEPPPRINVTTKGLKSLAWNIHKILKKRPFSSADQLSQTVEASLKSRIKKQKGIIKEQLEELSASERKKKQQAGRQSTRRRIYDALNVMIAVGLVVKKKQKITIEKTICQPSSKEIRFKNTSQTYLEYQRQLEEKYQLMQWKKEIIQKKREQLRLLELLVKRNKEKEEEWGNKISFPFMMMHFDDGEKIVGLNHNRTLIMVNYQMGQPMQVQGDTNILSHFIDESLVEVKKFLDMQNI